MIHNKENVFETVVCKMAAISLQIPLYLIWKYKRLDEYLQIYILMFIYQLNRIQYSQ